MSTSLIIFGFTLLGFTYPSSVPLAIQYWSIPIAFTGIALGGTMLFLCLITYSFDMRKVAASKASFVTSLITASNGLSAMVPYIFCLLYYHMDLSFRTIVLGFAAVIALPCIAMSWFIVAPADPEPEELDEPLLEKMETGAAKLEGSQDVSQAAGSEKGASPASEKKPESPKTQQAKRPAQEEAPVPVWRDILSGKMLFCAVSFALMMLHTNFYLSRYAYLGNLVVLFTVCAMLVDCTRNRRLTQQTAHHRLCRT